MEHWTFHDLRRTCSTELGKLGVPDHVIDRVLNHAAKTVADQHYNQHDYLPEKRHALDAWAARLAEIVGSAPAPMNVVPMRSRRDCATQQVSS
jgi:integrase